MIRVNFGTSSPVPFRFSDYSGTSLMLTAFGTISAETDDETLSDRLRDIALHSLSRNLRKYEETVTLDELLSVSSQLGSDISRDVSDKSGVNCTVTIEGITPDERSKSIIADMDRMKKFSDPAYAAAEMERAMKQAKETAERSGIPMPDPQNINIPDMPTLPDADTDPVARAMAITEHLEKLKQMSLSAPAASRPKFCGNCGSALPESGRFCPNCGKPV